MGRWLLRRLGADEAGVSVRVEVVAGVTTFMAMAYIIAVNPQILSTTGMPARDVLFATCASAAIASLVMAFAARYPIALAPGMGLNAYFAFEVCGGMRIPWQTALSAVLLSGLTFVVLSLTGLREALVRAIPEPVRDATPAGIGAFIAFLGLRAAGVVVPNEATLVGLGDLSRLETLLALFGLVGAAGLLAAQFRAALLLVIATLTAAGFLLGVAPLPAGIVALPYFPIHTAGVALTHLGDALDMGLVPVVFTFLFVDLFDTAGTLVGVGSRARLLRPDGTFPRMNRAFLADAIGTCAGGLLGTSTVTSYIESSAGVEVGGKSGLTAAVTAVCFLVALPFAPLVEAVPAFATAPVLIAVGALMMGSISRVKWDTPDDAVPALLVVLGMPLTFSISTGLGLGFVAYPLCRMLAGRGREVSLLAWVLAGLFAVRFWYLGA